MKIEERGPLTTLTDNVHVIFLTRAAFLGVGMLLGCGGVYELSRSWPGLESGSGTWFFRLLSVVTGLLAISLAFRIALSSVIIDRNRHEIRILRRTLMGRSQERYAFKDIDGGELGRDDGGFSFIRLRLRSGKQILLSHIANDSTAAKAAVAVLRTALGHA